jgi:hypothetical protein
VHGKLCKYKTDLDPSKAALLLKIVSLFRESAQAFNHEAQIKQRFKDLRFHLLHLFVRFVCHVSE